MTNVDFHEQIVHFFQRETVDRILSHVDVTKAGIFITEGTDSNVSSE